MIKRCVFAALALCAAAPSAAATVEIFDLSTPASAMLGGDSDAFTVSGATLTVLPNGIGGVLGDSLAALLGPQTALTASDDAANGLTFTTGDDGLTEVSFGGATLLSGLSGIPDAGRMMMRASDDRLHVRLWTSTAQHYDIALSTAFVSAPPAGVPEPGSWALMIAGLGLAGAGFRSKARGQRAFT